MSFWGTVGGIVKSAAPRILKDIPFVGGIVDTINVAKTVLHPQTAPANQPSAGALGNIPRIFTGGGPPASSPLPMPVAQPQPFQPPAPMTGRPALPALPPGAAGGGIVKGNQGQEEHGAVIYNRAAAGQHGHYTKAGTWSPRRRPRMNPMNVRAARKAVRRIHSAEKLFRRILSVSHPGKAHGHIAPKRSKRRA